MKHSILGLCNLCGRLRKIRCYNEEGKPIWKCRPCRDGVKKEEDDVE